MAIKKQNPGEEQHLPCPKIAPRQKELTPEQEVYARQFAMERIAAMLSPAAVDEAEAEEYLRHVYQVQGYEPPTIHWFDAPLPFEEAHFSSEGMRIWSGVADIIDNGGDSLGGAAMLPLWMSDIQECVGESVQEGMKLILLYGVWTSAQESVGASVWGNEWENVREDVLESVTSGAMNTLGASNWNSEWESVGASVRAYMVHHELAYYRFFHEMFEENKWIHLARFNEMVSGYRLGSTEAWLVRKPVRVERDEQGRLHSSNGMCLQYRDGWGFYAWHGRGVPEKIILHPEQITQDDWLRERNLEVRRAIQERLGHDRFVELVGATILDQSQRGVLVEVDLGRDPERVARYVRVQDSSTNRQYYLRVPPSISSADEAVAWTFGLSEQDYQPRQEA